MISTEPIIESTTLRIPPAQYRKLFSYIDACDTEVGGVATIKKISDTVFEVDEVFIVRQTAEGAYLRLEDNDLLRVNSQLSKTFVTESITKLKELSSKEKITMVDIVNYTQNALANEKNKNKLLLQWHSHVSMGTFASGTDYQTALRLSIGNPFYFMLIMNKAQDNSCYMMTRSPKGTWGKIDLDFIFETDMTEGKEEAKAEIAKYVFPHGQYRVNETTGIIEPFDGRWRAGLDMGTSEAFTETTEDKQDIVTERFNHLYGYQHKHNERKTKPQFYGKHYKPRIVQDRDFWSE